MRPWTSARQILVKFVITRRQLTVILLSKIGHFAVIHLLCLVTAYTIGEGYVHRSIYYENFDAFSFYRLISKKNKYLESLNIGIYNYILSKEC